MKELEILLGAVKQLPLWFWVAAVGFSVMFGFTTAQLFYFILWLKKN